MKQSTTNHCADPAVEFEDSPTSGSILLRSSSYARFFSLHLSLNSSRSSIRAVIPFYRLRLCHAKEEDFLLSLRFFWTNFSDRVSSKHLNGGVEFRMQREEAEGEKYLFLYNLSSFSFYSVLFRILHLYLEFIK